MNNIKMTRMWINQPSTLQPWHYMHGDNVLVEMGGKNPTAMVTVYFTKGEVVSMLVHRNALSGGWK